MVGTTGGLQTESTDAPDATTFSVTTQVDRLKGFRLKVLNGYEVSGKGE
jgi:hypothetical protein